MVLKQTRRVGCSDYEEEVRCADRVTYRHCGDRTSRLVARITRQLLKISQDTSNCYGMAHTGWPNNGTFTSLIGRSRITGNEGGVIHPLPLRAVLGKNIWGALPLIIWEATTAKRNYYRTNYINQ